MRFNGMSCRAGRDYPANRIKRFSVQGRNVLGHFRRGCPSCFEFAELGNRLCQFHHPERRGIRRCRREVGLVRCRRTGTRGILTALFTVWRMAATPHRTGSCVRRCLLGQGKPHVDIYQYQALSRPRRRTDRGGKVIGVRRQRFRIRPEPRPRSWSVSPPCWWRVPCCSTTPCAHSWAFLFARGA